MRVLGIDPGYGLVGWSIVEFKGNRFILHDVGVIETSPKDEYCDRLAEVYDDMCELVEQFKPDIAGIEQIFFQNNAKTAVDVAQARGVILLALTKGGVKCLHMTPPQVKTAVTGYGKSDKAAVQEAVKVMLGLKERIQPDDAADSVAVAISALSLYESRVR